jgi:DNA polymerase I
MQQELFEVLAEAKSLSDLHRIGPTAIQVRTKYLERLANLDVKKLAIHRRVSRMNYSHRCAEASAVHAYKKRGLPLASGMEIGYVVRDAEEWAVDPERDASDFDEVYYTKLLDKAWSEVAYSIGLNTIHSQR